METPNYPQEIIDGYKKLIKVNDRNNNGIEHCYGREYDNRQRNIRNAWNKFEGLCKSFGLNYIEVNSAFIPTKIHL